MTERLRPKIPKNPIVHQYHPDTLNCVASILDYMMTVDEQAQLGGNGADGYLWINRILVDAIRYVSDDLSYQANEKQEKKKESHDESQ